MRPEIKIVDIYREAIGETKIVAGVEVKGQNTRNFVMKYPGIVEKKDRYSTERGGKQKISSENLFLVGDKTDLREQDIVVIGQKEYKITNVKKGKKMICELEL